MSFPPPYVPYTHPHYPYVAPDFTAGPAPVYTMLIVGMVFFMAANVMPNLLPAADRVWNVAPFVLQWGFFIIIGALLVQMLGLLPVTPQLHITYVHMTIATLLFVIVWNQTTADLPQPAEERKPSSSSSSSSRDKPSEKKKEEKKEEKPAEPSPWDDSRSHPSAFLTTRFEKMVPWPFPLGKADRGGNELWWEKGVPSHVGHFNKPDNEAKKAEEEAQTKKKEQEEKEKAKAKEKDKDKEKVKGNGTEKDSEKERERAEKEAAAKAKATAEEAKKKKEIEREKAEAARKKAIEDRQKQKLWRTKHLAMITGISFLNKTLGFLLLLLFSLQLVSQELNQQPIADSSPSVSSSSSASSSSSSKTSSGDSEMEKARAEKEKLAKMQAVKEAEKAKAEGKSSSLSSSKPPSTSSTSRPSSSSSSRESSSSASSSRSSSSSSSSKSKGDPLGSEAVRKAADSKTVTHVDSEEGGFGVPYKVGFGLHYIHLPQAKAKDELDTAPMYIPSEGMSHPLMTTTYRQYAN
ncbi:hypothetical protein IAR55_002921 [Kwoniella newhampshirensis]|uniref:Uncharacterized protein n=1 Tax=Kwoniella newhampshirensis TaxID=1651941 RepID=A0AAW0Z082_9TREE